LIVNSLQPIAKEYYGVLRKSAQNAANAAIAEVQVVLIVQFMAALAAAVGCQLDWFMVDS
jgi:hypothetical protein